jgi:prepilin-type N-terminal cleavage/methylation domain-containing protein
MTRVRWSISPAKDEAGFTLVEMLVAMAMGVVVMGGVLILLVGAMARQPKLDQQATNVQTARFALERMTRETRNGIRVDNPTAASISYEGYVRHSTCGGTAMLSSTAQSIKCEITYKCSGTSCTRTEAAPGVYTGTPVTILSGIGNASSVFTWSPSSSPSYIGITLKIPDPEGSGALTISDGASLRNATLTN